jgi:hypothetical protein
VCNVPGRVGLGALVDKKVAKQAVTFELEADKNPSLISTDSLYDQRCTPRASGAPLSIPPSPAGPLKAYCPTAYTHETTTADSCGMPNSPPRSSTFVQYVTPRERPHAP